MKHTEMVKLMGELVVVSWVLERQIGHDSSRRIQKAYWRPRKLKKVRTGWIIGFRHVQEGYTEPGSDGGYGIDGLIEGIPPEWKTERVIPCVLVAFWPTEKPKYVPMDGFSQADDGAPDPYALSGGWAENPEWRKELSKFMKAEMKNWPRDKKGRWVKK